MLPSPAAAIGDPVSGSQFPAVGIFLDKATQQPSNCSAVLIGCRSVLSNCASRYSIGRSQILFPNAGRFDIVDVKLHPGLADIYASGVAVLILDRPVTGITPARVSTLIDPADYAAGTPGTVVSYNAFHAGIKHALKVRTSSCPSSSYRSEICWERQPNAAQNLPSWPSRFDYGGVLFVDLGAGPVVAGLQAGGSHAIDLFRMRDFVQWAVAQDDDAECLAQPVLGGDAVAHFSFIDFLTAKAPSIERRFDVLEGASELRVVMSATPGGRTWQERPGSGPDLFLARGTAAGPDSYDCAIEDSLGYGACVIPAPAPGTWTARTERTDLPGVHQVTVTVIGAAPGRCGDGVRDALEECDGDDPAGCPAACLVTCRCDRCGDHILDFGEQCDDGTTAGDGCDACTIEPPELSGGGRFRGSVSPIRPDRFKLTLTAPSRIRLRLSDHGSYTNAIGSVSREGVPLFEFELQQAEDDTSTFVAQAYGLAAGTYDVLIYEDLPGADAYTLDVTVTPATCGDGHVEDGAEECEDGNTVAGDGCSADCLVETVEISTGGSFAGGNAGTPFDRYTFRAVDGEQLFLRSYDAGGQCPAPATVELWLLEGGRRWPVAGDSYDSPPSCVVLPDLRLVEGDYELRISGAYDYYDYDRRELEPYTLTVGRSVCGDGVIGAGEECDDGNRSGGDGCDAACNVEACNSCTGQPSACAATADATPCSDGVHCNGSDACSAGACVAGGQSPCTLAAPCALECDEALDTCACEPAPWVGCGDGKLRSGEECDDGNRLSGDGCDWSCDVERCQQCHGEPSICQPIADGTPCPDSSFCNGVDTCQTGECTQHSGDPCADDGECNDWCDEAYDDCAQPFGTPCSGTAGDCMHDVCDGAGTCMARPDRQACPLTLACGGSFVIGAPAFGARRAGEFHDFVLTDAATVRITLTLDSGPCPASWRRPYAGLRAVQPDGSERYVSYASYIGHGAACTTAEYFAVAGHYRIVVGAYHSTVPAYTLSVEATCPRALGCGADVELPDGPLFLALDADAARVSIASADASGACPSDSGSVVELAEIRHEGDRIVDVDGGSRRCARLEQELRRGHYSVDTRRYWDWGGSLITRLRVEDCATCGDGQVGRGETCDDSATAGGDGCSPTCTIEPCHVCTGEPSSCAAVKADGAPCDDGVFCNGPDQCLAGTCSGHAGNPCPGAGACSFACNEESQTCQSPLGKPCQSDADPCTHDACDVAGSCEHLADTSACRADVECAVAMILTPVPWLDPGRVEFTIDELRSVQIDTYDVAGTCAGPGAQLELFQVLEDQSVELVSSAVADDPLQCPRIQTHLDAGNYAVEVTSLFAAAVPPVRIFAACAGCGDGLLQPDESCDDGNAVSGDGCDLTCQQQTCWICQGSPSQCAPGSGQACNDATFCNGADTCIAGACESHAGDPCTDGECIDRTCDEGAGTCRSSAWPAGSDCDDLDACTAADSCDGQGACRGRLLAECGATCGDASLDFGEECDDGNSASDDGCTTLCAVCGNGVLASAEQCDDGDVAYIPGDACAMDCTLVPCGCPVTGAGPTPMAKDALFVLRAAVGAAWCSPRVCDTDSSGVIDAVDGLRVLLRAVGGAEELDCPVGLAVTTTTLVPVSTTSSPIAPDIQ